MGNIIIFCKLAKQTNETEVPQLTGTGGADYITYGR